MLPSLTLESLRSAVRRLLMGGAWLCPILPADALCAGAAGDYAVRPARAARAVELDAARVEELWSELMRRELPDW
ncbi:hypothetical protein FZ103_13005 [Streptomonospora sp. PA3]|uniref:hypothetical protein n=1 Tax=Streptomonospora sp. PA3 TaxID=2607326 RepID=UPI0012DE6A91|nr:hypothetical protein [Streptomonospora sp. PA3]MUL42084.1 hypothetical protein [Streptomonospora sp. PA3]